MEWAAVTAWKENSVGAGMVLAFPSRIRRLQSTLAKLGSSTYAIPIENDMTFTHLLMLTGQCLNISQQRKTYINSIKAHEVP